MVSPLRIGTRESQLAVWQATLVQERLAKNGVASELVYIKSEGDIDTVTPLYQLGVQGVFTKTLDAALLKNWHVRESQRVEFRLEASNVRNHPIFSDPPTSYGASNFGVISGTKVGARSVQLVFKYYF